MRFTSPALSTAVYGAAANALSAPADKPTAAAATADVFRKVRRDSVNELIFSSFSSSLLMQMRGIRPRPGATPRKAG